MSWSTIIAILSLIVAAVSIIASSLGSCAQIRYEKYKVKSSAFEKYLSIAYKALDVFTISNLVSESESNSLKNTWNNFISNNYQILIYISPRSEPYLFSYTECQRVLLKQISNYLQKVNSADALSENSDEFDKAFQIWYDQLVKAYRCVVLTIQIESLRPIIDWYQIQKLKAYRKNFYTSLSSFLSQSNKEC